MDELRALTKEERKYAYETVFQEAFPKNELRPLHTMERMIEAGEYIFFGMFRDGQPTCYICTWKDENYVLIDYLCVPKNLRCGGIGSKTLTMMMAQFPENTVFIGETEAEVGDPARDALIRRRKGLYLRLGAQLADYDIKLFGVHYNTILWAKDRVDIEEVKRRHAGFYRRNMPKPIYAAMVQIPYVSRSKNKSEE